MFVLWENFLRVSSFTFRAREVTSWNIREILGYKVSFPKI